MTRALPYGAGISTAGTTTLLVFALGLLVAIRACPCCAQPVDTSVSGILAGTWQHADGSGSGAVSDYGEGNAQLDLFVHRRMGPGRWNMEVKGGTTPRSDGVAAAFPETNGLSGETLDAQDRGRAAVTQLNYGLPLRGGWANPNVSSAAEYLGAEVARPVRVAVAGAPRRVTLGVGLGETRASTHIQGPQADAVHAEAYARFHLGSGLTVSPDLQWLRHSGLDPARPSTWVEGVRVGASF